MRISDWSSDVRSSDLAAWQVEHAGHRLLAWLVCAPLILSGRDDRWRRRMLGAMETTARWLDRHVGKNGDGLGDRTGGVSGKGVSVRVELGDRRHIKKKII